MEDFRNYLLKSRVANTKTVTFYLHWVTQFFNHCRKHPQEDFTFEEQAAYLKQKARSLETWQLDQAREAIEVYRFWKSRQNGKSDVIRMDTRMQWKTVGDDMASMIRLRHLAKKTEQAYLGWVRRFYRFVNGKPPNSLNDENVKDFLTHLAVERKVSATTQNQAFSALLFLYRHILDKPLENIGESIRAKRRKRLPVVLTQNEVAHLLSELSGVNLLMAQIIYGGGLRLKECLQLRVKDVDLERKTVIVRSGKGDKDRETVLPGSIKSDLKKHLENIKALYDKDRNSNQPGVSLPGALEKKLPNAGKEWPWFWVFPSYKLSSEPDTGLIRRHHIYPGVLQRNIRKAAIKAKIYKRVTVHTLRHCFATHLVEQGCDIRTIQDLLGHRHLETTMVYTHVAQTNRLGIVGPLDKKEIRFSKKLQQA